ncbi:hypothetical protein [Pedobacter sp. MW01-1-1]|uniref:hypothetical protein n=1 Tax=Pedobacter sp. MW01-1-1 TaxID=3383027 RepID=UPI003FF0E98C
MDIETFFKGLEEQSSISSSLKAYLRVAFKEFDLKDNEALDYEIRKSNPIIFVKRGFLKTKLESKLDPGKRLLTFHFEGTILPHLLEKNTEDFMLETYSVNDATILLLSKGHFANLYKVFPEFGQLISKLHGELILELFHKALDLHHYKAEERLEKLLKKHPSIFQRATVTDIAASIGMHANTLSNLKNKNRY